MKTLVSILVLAVIAMTSAMANEQTIPLDRAPDRTRDLAALQRGARLFVNYCLNCHSANQMRYSRLRDIGISAPEVEDNLLFTMDKVGNMMHIAMRVDDAKAWFGTDAPDLSLIARARGRDWLYTYLRSFYRDDSRPTGWNNRLFENVAMPHVLWQLQGQRTLQSQEDNSTPDTILEFSGYRQLTSGTLSAIDYDSAVADLVAYLSWMAEPVQQQRRRLGVWVILFLSVLSLFAWRLNVNYWKDVK
ncbi:cytochrome c1 [Mycoavidus sp. B2-EB]|uniref:cytochrome c1 n=1 Tax=Mycoavidus sp. B2-EB TaxID=2651972 RepID=UPI00162AC006|nr:cytochrome c1 [Mycoavidus sp. B2-EB]